MPHPKRGERFCEWLKRKLSAKPFLILATISAITSLTIDCVAIYFAPRHPWLYWALTLIVVCLIVFLLFRAALRIQKKFERIGLYLFFLTLPLTMGLFSYEAKLLWKAANAQTAFFATAAIIATMMFGVETGARQTNNAVMNKDVIALHTGWRAAIALSLFLSLLGGVVHDPRWHAALGLSVLPGLLLSLAAYVTAPFRN